MSSTGPQILIAHRSEKGPRETNQDAVLVRELPEGGWLIAVADGMGGLEAGEIASQTAIQVFEQQVMAGRPLISAVEDANAAVLRRADDIPMGTTLVAALIRSDGIRIVNVGDSRAYRLGPEGATQITRDHTVRAEAELNGMDPLDPASERWSNALTRSLGAGLRVHVDEFGPIPIHRGDRLLLCSDGLHGVLAEEEIGETLRSARDAGAAVDALIELALEAGTHDNLSSVVAVVDHVPSPRDRESGPVAPGAPAGADATLTQRGRSPTPTVTQPWNPAKLASLSHRPLTSKPQTRWGIVALILLLVTAAVLYFLLV